jgi:hypothetical protein
MIAVHPIHRRLAALTFKSERQPLSEAEQTELFQCLKVNAQIVTLWMPTRLCPTSPMRLGTSNGWKSYAPR